MGIDAFKNKTFGNIVVMPTTRLSRSSIIVGESRVVMAGGPCYEKSAPKYVRQCVGMIPMVVDESSKAEEPEDRLDSGVWCGHVHRHFGYLLSRFATRIAVSAARHPEKFLLFAVRPNADIDLIPGFFWDIVSALGAKKENVRFINKPTLVKELTVYAQAERHYNGRPSRSYLELLNSLRPPIRKCYRAIYFSRANYLKGGIAGERYLEEVMREIGVVVVRPEEYPLEKQIAFCRQAETLIFAEGSAVHLLQLVGTGIGDVIILNRRRGSIVHSNFFAIGSIAPRAKSVNYINSIRDIVYCKPEIRSNHGITVLEPNKKFFGRFKKYGFDIEKIWDTVKYQTYRNECIIKWLDTLPVKIWKNNRFYRKVDVLTKLSSGIREKLKEKQLIYEMWNKLSELGIFDEGYYLTANPDVEHAEVDALEHYIKDGWKEDRNPSAYFDSKFYLSQFPDGYTEIIDPLSHYILKGWKVDLNPNSEFNVRVYSNRYPEVKLKELEPLQHYVEYGQFLGYSATD